MIGCEENAMRNQIAALIQRVGFLEETVFASRKLAHFLVDKTIKMQAEIDAIKNEAKDATP